MTTQTSYASTVNSFYLAFYGRPADPAGLQYWSQQLANANGNLTAISTAFATSEEATARFGSDSVIARVTTIYQQLFNRAPDSAGLTYWVDAIAKGNASVAQVAINILQGAKGTDLALATLRESAMDSFTASVSASGSSYAGTAAVEAARVLVRAVTLDSSAADVSALVKATVAFADVATKTPAVVAAIATGGTLLGLFDTTRGTADPVALAQTLADTAKAAAGSPATLDALLRGGGIAQVLKVMPADASLHDVVAALAVGGLPAAVQVVYPTVPAVVPPTFALTLAYQGVTQGAGDTHVDNVTNVGHADVRFSYTGHDLDPTQHFEYSIDGTHWIAAGIAVSTAGKTVTVTGVDLTAGAAGTGLLAPANLVTTVSLRAVDASGETTTPVSQQLVYDHAVATPRIVLANDTAGAVIGSSTDLVSQDGHFSISGIEAGATVQYLVDSTPSLILPIILPSLGPTLVITNTVPTTVASWTATAPALHEGVNGLSVRQIDAAGNVSDASHVSITIDTIAPSAPSIALVNDSGILGDSLSADGRIAITGLETGTASAWEYSTNGGTTWTFGGANNGSGSALLDLTALGDGAKNVEVRQYDAAGNVGQPSNALAFTLDPNAPAFALQLAFKGVTQGEGDTHVDNVTNVANASVQFSYTGTDLGAGQHFEYSLDGQTWLGNGIAVSTVDHVVTIQNVDLSAGTAAPSALPGLHINVAISQPNLSTTVYLRAVDAGGAATVPVSQTIVYDHYAATPYVVLANDSHGENTGSPFDQVTSDAHFSVSGVEAGATVQYLVNTPLLPSISIFGSIVNINPVPLSTWTGTAPTLLEGVNSVSVRQIDAAGNISASSQTSITLDTHAPVAPTLALGLDSGSSGSDGITNSDSVTIGGLELDPTTGWNYSLDGGATWRFGALNNGSGQAMVHLRDLGPLGDGAVNVLVRQVDAAGNVGAASTSLGFTLDTTAPSTGFSFDHLQGAGSTLTTTTLAAADVVFAMSGDAAAGDVFQYRLDGGSWIALDRSTAYDSATHLLDVAQVALGTQDHAVEVRLVDAAGNAGASAVQTVHSTVSEVPVLPVIPVIPVIPIFPWLPLPMPLPATISGVQGSMAGSVGQLSFAVGPYNITQATPSALTLSVVSHGAVGPASSTYLDTASLTGTNVLTLGAKPAIDLYQLSWNTGSFHTDAPYGMGYITAGSSTFVTGSAGALSVDGFTVTASQQLQAGESATASNLDNLNSLFMGPGVGSGRIHTGGGMDVVVDKGGNITVAYDVFDKSAMDVILGFRTGSDVIELSGIAGNSVDTSHNGAIAWTSTSTNVVIGSVIEGVRLLTSGTLAIGADGTPGAATVTTLNSMLNVATKGIGDHLLILAGTGDHDALFYYQEQNGNGVIDANELTVVAVAAQGIINPADIHLVGTIINPV